MFAIEVRVVLSLLMFGFFLELKFLMLFLLLLIGIAFFTLFERKVMGLSHLRFGPDKVRFSGVLQPIGDAVKLFRRGGFKGFRVNFLIYLFMPLFGFILMLFLWGVFCS